MARKSQHTFSKRQREQKKAEKALQKRAKRAEAKLPSELLDETVETVVGDSEFTEGPSETTEDQAPPGDADNPVSE
jgi:hypothetical protein